jgi:hypothetical protein
LVTVQGGYRIRSTADVKFTYIPACYLEFTGYAAAPNATQHVTGMCRLLPFLLHHI